MKNAMQNLIDNAAYPDVEATQISIEAFSGTPGNPFIRIIVQDNGRGIGPQETRMAFDPFYTTKKHDGTGLGLAIVRGTLHQFGGTVSLQSDANQGTRVTMQIPVSQNGDNPDSDHQHAQA